ncbi:MAG: transposon-encoded TnpW family protein, partial [Clostridiales bacterium]|nr:transposon-encoded TnpW family protein [Clostridiales bacterium]
MTRETTAAAASPAAPKATYFNRKIGNTTFVVSVSFSETATESVEDKILRLVASEIQNGEVQKCC